MAERAVGDALPVGRHGDVAQRLDLELGGVDLLLEADGLVHRLLDVRGERHRRALAAGDVDAPDLALAPDHDRLAVGHPGVLRIEAVDRPRFLQVLVEAIEERPVAAGLEIADVQLAAEADAADVGEPLAVGADARRDGAALDRHGGALAPGVQVAPDDRVDGAVGILVVFEQLPGRDVLAVIEVAAVGGDGRLAGVLLEAVLLGDLQAVGSGGVEHPDLAGAERSLRHEVPAREDEAAVGDQAGLLMNQRLSRDTCFAFLPSASIVQMFQRPSRSLANAMRLPSGLKRGCMSKAGPLVMRVAGGRAAAADRHRVDVAEQVEDDRAGRRG